MEGALAALEEKRDALNQETAAVRSEMLGLLDGAVGMIIDAQRQATRYGVLLIVAALSIGLVVAATVTVNLVRPLRRLVKGAVAVEGGSLDTELPITTRDEVGALTIAFNRMIRELRTKERVRETFGKYVDPRIVEGLAVPGRFELGFPGVTNWKSFRGDRVCGGAPCRRLVHWICASV